MEAKRRLDKKKAIQAGIKKKRALSANDEDKGGWSSTRGFVDVVDPSEIVRNLGDHVDTRMKEIGADEELDEELFQGRDRELREEAVELHGVAQQDLTSVAAAFASGLCRDTWLGHNRNSVTCVALRDAWVWFGDKVGVVCACNMDTQEKVFLAPALTCAVMSLAISNTRGARTSSSALERSTVDNSCSSYAAVGGADGTIHIWKAEARSYQGTLKLHRTAVTGLAFRTLTNTLYSCSNDSTVRVWSVPEMLAVDRLFGHHGAVLAIAALRKDRAVTGGYDRTARYWKIEAGTQVEYAAQSAPAECVAFLNDDTFVVGTANGTIAAFDVGKLNPLCAVECAHGSGDPGDGTGLELAGIADALAHGGMHASSKHPPIGNAIFSLAAPPQSNLVVSGGYDGFLRIWQFIPRGGASGGGGPGSSMEGPKPAQLVAIGSLKAEGVINGLAMSPDGKVLVAAVAKEPRLGRWITRSRALNGVHVFAAAAEANSAKNSAAVVPRASRPTNAPKQATRQARAQPPLPTAAATVADDGEHSEDEIAEEEDDSGEMDDRRDGADDDEEAMFVLGENGQLVFTGAQRRTAEEPSSSSATSRKGKTKKLRDVGTAGTKAAVPKKSSRKIIKGKPLRKAAPLTTKKIKKGLRPARPQ